MDDDEFLKDLEALYRVSFHRHLRVAEAICGDLNAARDAVQDAFARAIRFRGSFRGDGPLEGWVWRIVVNTARKASRKPAPAVRYVSELEPHSGAGPEAVLSALVARLPERQRLVLFLYYYADLEYTTIAETLGIAVGTVGATLSTARAALRAELEEVDHA